MEQNNTCAPPGKQESNEEEESFPGGEAGNMDTFGLHHFLQPPLVLNVKMLSISVMKSYLLIW